MLATWPLAAWDRHHGDLIDVVVLVHGAALASSGCSVYMAANQPSQKDLTVLQAGQPRAKVIAELGPPQNSEVKGGQRHDIFTFTQGYHGGVKAGRAIHME